uniref:DUF6824 domain-containing protein n=1 Tax=Pseudo-nitzschia australis TaxID=44445 RepID=A0A7S4AA70_9STRA|mmetsp:Transcript_1743/g.3888  ORF Transcript_1743/g.3888 Transcript_1743/m.3888 type:complete len:623 (-) Transcript_1743:311-2179(-)
MAYRMFASLLLQHNRSDETGRAEGTDIAEATMCLPGKDQRCSSSNSSKSHSTWWNFLEPANPRPEPIHNQHQLMFRQGTTSTNHLVQECFDPLPNRCANTVMQSMLYPINQPQDAEMTSVSTSAIPNKGVATKTDHIVIGNNNKVQNTISAVSGTKVQELVTTVITAPASPVIPSRDEMRTISEDNRASTSQLGDAISCCSHPASPNPRIGIKSNVDRNESFNGTCKSKSSTLSLEFFPKHGLPPKAKQSSEGPISIQNPVPEVANDLLPKGITMVPTNQDQEQRSQCGITVDLEEKEPQTKKTNHTMSKKLYLDRPMTSSNGGLDRGLQNAVRNQDLKSKPMPKGSQKVQVCRNDVLSYRGDGCYLGKQTHHGNIRYQEMVLSRTKEYIKCNADATKRAIIGDLINSIESMNPPGRFLKVDKDCGHCCLMSKSQVFLNTQIAFQNTKLAVRSTASPADPDNTKTTRPKSQRLRANEAKERSAAKTKIMPKNLASFNLPGPRNTHSDTISVGRPKRQRLSVTFFKPDISATVSGRKQGRIDNKNVRKSKRKRDVSASATSATVNVSSLRAANATRRSQRKLKCKKEETHNNDLTRSQYRLSTKIARRVITNAVICFEQHKLR